MAFGAPLPGRPLVLLPALVFGSLMSAGMALATAAFTASAELAQVTVTPFFFAAIAGAAWVLSTDSVTVLMQATPGGALADLVRQGWEAGGSAWIAIASLLAWTAVGAAIAKRWFRWEPRR